MRNAPLSQRVHPEPSISVVIAVGDHEDSIGHAIRTIAAHLGRLGRSFEILAVNAGSSDNSFSIINILAASMPELRVLGRGSAGRPFLRGSSEARGEVVVLLDAGRSVSLAPLGWALPAARRSCFAGVTSWRAAWQRSRSSCAPAGRDCSSSRCSSGARKSWESISWARAPAGKCRSCCVPCCAFWPPDLAA
jgi:hypothetical protein